MLRRWEQGEGSVYVSQKKTLVRKGAHPRTAETPHQMSTVPGGFIYTLPLWHQWAPASHDALLSEALGHVEVCESWSPGDTVSYVYSWEALSCPNRSPVTRPRGLSVFITALRTGLAETSKHITRQQPSVQPSRWACAPASCPFWVQTPTLNPLVQTGACIPSYWEL